MSVEKDAGSPTEKEQAASEGKPPPKRRRSTLLVLILIDLMVAGVCVLQWLAPSYDRQFFNIYTWMLCVGIIVVPLVWFMLFTSLRWRVRLLPVIAIMVVVGFCAATLEVRGWGGTFLPELHWRWSARPDEQLEVPDPGKTLDLSGKRLGGDFPQFLGPNRDLVVRGVNLARNWHKNPPKQLWRQEIGAGSSAFSAVGGYAVTMEQRGAKELVVCYDVKTGDVMWSHGINARHVTQLGGVGPRSTPTIHEGRVFALGATGVFRCLDFKTGDELWRHNLLELYAVPSTNADLEQIAWGRAGSPLIVDNLVIVPAGGVENTKLGPVSLVAFDKANGKKVWESGNRQVSYSSPNVATIAGERQIIIANQNYVSGHSLLPDENGKTEVLWEFDWPGMSNTGANTSQAVALPGDRILISKGYGGGGAVFQISKDTNGKFHAEEIWHNRRVLKTKLTNVAVHDGFGYALSDGILECVELESGKSRWKGGRDDEFDHGQILMVDDVLLVLTEDGQVAMLELNPDEQREFGRFQAIEGKTWNNICLHGRVLLVRNAEEAAAYLLPVNDPQEPEVQSASFSFSPWIAGLVIVGIMFLWHVFLLVVRRRPALG